MKYLMLLLLLAKSTSIDAQTTNECSTLISFRDGELVSLMDKAIVDFDDTRLKYYQEHKQLLMGSIKSINDDKPWVGADGTQLLETVKTLSDRFIGLTSSLIPGAGTKAIGYGYATLSDFASGKISSEKITILIAKESLEKKIGENVNGALNIAISTGLLVNDIIEIGDNYQKNKKIEQEVKNIMGRIQTEVNKYDALITKFKDGKAEFMYLNRLKNWIDSTCN